MGIKLTYEFVKGEFEKSNCELLAKTYDNKDVKMNYRCECGDINQISYANFRNGRRCKTCGIKKYSEARKLDFEYVKSYFQEQGCQLLTTEYTNTQTPMDYVCNCGNEAKMNFGNFKKGRRCVKCKAKTNSEKQRMSIENVTSILEADGYKLVEGKYENNQSKLLVKCPVGHEVIITLGSFQIGHKCRICGIKNRSGKNHYNWYDDRKLLKQQNLLKSKCRKALITTLKCVGVKKNNRTYKLLGYNFSDLRNHIEKHPNWEKVKDGIWHLDHIFPIKAFVDYKLMKTEYIKIINDLSNLQPLNGIENLEKYSKYNKVEFENWLKDKGVKFDSLI